MFLPFPSLGEGGGCKKILREIFSLELPVTGGRGRFYKVIYKFVWLCFRILNFWITVHLRFLHMFGIDSVRHMFGIPLPKNVCGRKKIKYSAFKSYFDLFNKTYSISAVWRAKQYSGFDVMIILLFGMSNVIQFFINLIMLG